MTHLPVTTHTIEMAQIADINSRLATRDKHTDHRGTARPRGGDGGRARRGQPAAGRRAGQTGLGRPARVSLYSRPFLRGFHHRRLLDSRAPYPVVSALSHRLGAQHVWGLGSVPERDNT